METRFMSEMNRIWPGVLLFLQSLSVWGGPAVIQNFTLREYVNHGWTNELVEFPLNAAAATQNPNKLRLMGPDNRAVPFQLIHGTQETQIAFLTDLPPLSERTFRLESGAGVSTSDIAVIETKETIQLVNSRTGVECPVTSTAARHGPMARLRLASGRWIGKGRLLAAPEIQSYTAQVTARGPVFAEVECRYAFEGGGSWALRFRVMAQEPVVRVSERFHVTSNALWKFDIAEGFKPTHGMYRTTLATQSTPGMGYVFKPLTSELRLVPWLPWHLQDIGCYLSFMHVPDNMMMYRDARLGRLVREKKPPLNSATTEKVDTSAIDDLLAENVSPKTADGNSITAEDDLLFLAAGRSSLWVDPGQDGQSKAIPIQSEKDGTWMVMQLAGPNRDWLIGAGTVADIMEPESIPSLAQRMYVKHFCSPLQWVNQMVLAWPDTEEKDYPRLLFSKEQLEALRSRKIAIMDGFPNRRLIKQALLEPSNQVAQAQAATQMLSEVQSAVDWFLAGRISAENTGPHNYGFLVNSAVAAADLTLGSSAVTAEQIRQVRAQLAFLGYKLASPDLLSPERNFGALPNMIAIKEVGLGIVGAFLRSHPLAKTWTQSAETMVRHQIEEWSGPNGAWLEALHYQGVSMDVYLWFGLAAKRAGFSDIIDHPQLRKTMLFMAKALTPPDPDWNGLRLLPAIGNTYRGERTSLPGLGARIWRSVDPELAGQLEWAWRQQGRFWNVGVGGDNIIHWHSDFILAEELSDCGEKPPKWASESFPKFGSILRAGFPGDRETYMIYHQGEFHSHYDNDQGSFEFWGKGRPLCRDWGYFGCMPAWQHNKVETGGWGTIREFSAQESADYQRSVASDWERQILLVKDVNPSGATYAVLRDYLTPACQSTNWWLWLNAEAAPRVDGDTVRMIGRYDVDMDVWLAPPFAQQLPRKTQAELDQELKAANDSPTNSPVTLGLSAADTDALDAALDEPMTKIESSVVRTIPSTVKTFAAMPNGQFLPNSPMTQQGLCVQVPREHSLLAILYPRLRTEKAPIITPLAGGKGARIESATGVDYVFLGRESFTFAEGDVSFEGTTGVIQIRGKKAFLSLGATGRLKYKDQERVQ
jgi:hypothetical protein